MDEFDAREARLTALAVRSPGFLESIRESIVAASRCGDYEVRVATSRVAPDSVMAAATSLVALGFQVARGDDFATIIVSWR